MVENLNLMLISPWLPIAYIPIYGIWLEKKMNFDIQLRDPTGETRFLIELRGITDFCERSKERGVFYLFFGIYGKIGRVYNCKFFLKDKRIAYYEPSGPTKMKRIPILIYNSQKDYLKSLVERNKNTNGDREFIILK